LNIIGICLIPLLLAGGEKETSPLKKEAQESQTKSKQEAKETVNPWTPYAFTGSDHFKFNISLTKGEEKSEGMYILDLKKGKEDDMTMHIKGEWDKNTFESTVTVSEDDLFSALIGHMIMNPAAAPLLVTLFTPYWSTYLAGRDWKIGSGWEVTSEGESASFKVVEECKHAGIKGLRGVLKQNEETLIETCVSPDVALPLAINFKGDESYSLELIEYTE
jgi:hypothetical protein